MSAGRPVRAGEAAQPGCASRLGQAPQLPRAGEAARTPRPMRRARRAVTSAEDLAEIIERCDVVRVGSCDAEGPFIVPMSFGFERGERDGRFVWTFWLHSAQEGRKADAWRADPRVALELDVPVGVIKGDFACTYSFAYESVMATGTVTPVTDEAEKRRGLALIMAHMAPDQPATFPDEAVRRVAVWRVDVEEGSLTGKRRT